VHIVLQRDDATLTDAAADDAVSAVLDALQREHGATPRSK
jgi:phenylalanyl-tRNA synthetase beta subunit